MLMLKKNHLKAALIAAAKEDVRYYLNGVCLEACANGDVHLIGCDGHRLFAGLLFARDVEWTLVADGQAAMNHWFNQKLAAINFQQFAGLGLMTGDDCTAHRNALARAERCHAVCTCRV